MNTDGDLAPTSLQLARGLVAREAAQARNGDSEMVGVLQRTCSRVCENLRRSVGEDGFNALLVRALARTEAHYPQLRTLQRSNNGSIHLDEVAASVELHGVDAVTAAIEALLASLIEMLRRLIGEEMTIQLIDHQAPRLRTQAGEQT